MIKFTDVFLSFLSHVALVLFSQVMQQQTLGENDHLIASYVGNVHIKNY